MKLYLVCFIVCISCSKETKYNSVAFEFLPENKSELKKHGYKNMVIKHSSSEFSRKSGFPEETVLEDVLQKNINDTFIQFTYEKDRLLSKSIYFSRKKFDSANLFQNLAKRGFKIITSQTNSVYEVRDSNKKWHYKLYYNRREIGLFLELGKRQNPFPHPPGVEVGMIDSPTVSRVR